MSSLKACDVCGTGLMQFPFDHESIIATDGQEYWGIDTNWHDLFCPRCISYYYECDKCNNKCQFIGVYKCDAYMDEGDPIFDFSGQNINYAKVDEIENLTREPIVGENGGKYSIWYCRTCNERYGNVTDK
jgi:hypothetical protein